jgi:hypothetical protein
LEVPRELLIREWVNDSQHVGLQDYVGTKRALSWNLIQLNADFRFIPDSLLVDKRYNCGRSVASNSGQANKIIEHLLRRRSQNPKAPKNFETVMFVFW